MTTTVKNYLRRLEHCGGDINKVVSVLEASAEDDTLRELLLESGHDYRIDGASRTYLEAIIYISFVHDMKLHTGTGRITTPHGDEHIDEDIRQTIDELMEDIFDHCDDMDDT